jgi:hypothetical protein
MDRAKGILEPSLKKWLGIGVRLLATLFFLLAIVALNRCGKPLRPGAPTAVLSPTPSATARLDVQVRPAGATVAIDGQPLGTTPLTLELSAGRHTIRVELEGYEPLEQTVTLSAGGEAAISGELSLSPTLSSPGAADAPTAAMPDSPLPDLVATYAKIELETGRACDYLSTELGVRLWIKNQGDADAGPFAVDVNDSRQRVGEGLASGGTMSLWFAGYVHSGENVIVVDAALEVEEADEENNTLSQLVPIPTLPPTCTPLPAAAAETPTPAPVRTEEPVSPTARPQAVAVREEQVAILTYPYADFIEEAWSETFNMPYAVLDRGRYEASNPVPEERSYQSLVLENEVLKLTFLPELGGRLYEVYYKPSGHRATYRNPVLKPSPWGPPEQGWWLAGGGIEWCLPVEEHGYEWGVPWKHEVKQDATGAMVILRNTEATDRVRAEVAVRLAAGAGAFTIEPRLENPTSAPLAVKYWTNAMLAPGGQNAPSADLRFVLPDDVTDVTVHSRGDDYLPDYNERMTWPVVGDRDLSRLGNWNRWLGFFEDPAQGGFMALYDEGLDEGIVRIFPIDKAPGAKVFAAGWADPIASSNWTDDGSGYVEIHGGPAATFDDSVTLPAGGHLEWTETWYPVAGLGGLRYADATAALNLTAAAGQAHLAMAVAHPWSGQAVLTQDGQERWREQVSLAPGRPLRRRVALGDDAAGTAWLVLLLEALDGTTVSEYGAEVTLD